MIEHEDWRLAVTTAAAVALADRHRARLTLIKTTAPNWHTVCRALSPICLPLHFEAVDGLCGRTLAAAAAQVPPQIPLKTMLLGARTSHDLERLLASEPFDAIVASGSLLRRRRVRRELARQSVRAIVPDGMQTGSGRVRWTEGAFPGVSPALPLANMAWVDVPPEELLL